MPYLAITPQVEEQIAQQLLSNFMGTDLYERQGHALTNFKQTLPEETSDLAQELTKDPYDFAFSSTIIIKRYKKHKKFQKKDVPLQVELNIEERWLKI